MKNQSAKLPVFLIRVVTKDDYVIEKEVSSDNEYHALLDFQALISYDLNLNYSDKDYIVTAVVQVD